MFCSIFCSSCFIFISAWDNTGCRDWINFNTFSILYNIKSYYSVYVLSQASRLVILTDSHVNKRSAKWQTFLKLFLVYPLYLHIFQLTPQSALANTFFLQLNKSDHPLVSYFVFSEFLPYLKKESLRAWRRWDSKGKNKLPDDIMVISDFVLFTFHVTLTTYSIGIKYGDTKNVYYDKFKTYQVLKI